MTIVTFIETMMTSNDDKKHSVSNWFSSLRRQPKPKKFTNKNHLQKSCVDLSTSATNSTSLPVSVTNSPKLKSGCSHFAHNHTLTSKSSDVPTLLPTCATEITPNLNEKLNKLSNNVSDLPGTTSVRCIDNGESSKNAPAPIVVHTGKTVTTVTRKITKVTVIKNKEQNFRRAGLIFDDNGKLISESIAYQNFTKNFRSNLIANVGNDTLKNNETTIACDIQNSNDKASSSALPMNDCTAIQCNVKVNVSGIDGFQEQSETSCCSISDRLITSNNLDDEIEFIDSSSSLSDICSTSNSAADDIYFNTLPKLPKSYASIKQQKSDKKSGRQNNIQKKVE